MGENDKLDKILDQQTKILIKQSELVTDVKYIKRDIEELKNTSIKKVYEKVVVYIIQTAIIGGFVYALLSLKGLY